MRLERTMKKLGKINNKEMSLETKAKIIHALVFTITMYICTVKKVDRKNWILEESSMDTLDHQKDQ